MRPTDSLFIQVLKQCTTHESSVNSKPNVIRLNEQNMHVLQLAEHKVIAR